MVLYNVTFHLHDTRSLLKAAIPISAADDENKTMPRVCFADSIENCIAAIGPSFRDLCVGRPIWVRTADIPESWLMTPQELFDKGYVPDALEHHEHWCLHDIDVVAELYSIESFQTDRVLAFSCIKVEDVKQIVKSYNHVPERVDEYSDAQALYSYCLRFYEALEEYDLVDALWDDLAELPWAQSFQVNNLKLRKACITEFANLTE